VKYTLEAFGIKESITRFERMGTAAIAAEPAMEAVLKRLMRIIGQTFESEGRRGGGSWKQDTEDWLLRKQRNGLDPRIGHATLALRESVSIWGADHQIRDVGPNYAKLGSDLPYADTSQRHRPFIKLTKLDKVGLRTIVRDYLIMAWRLAA
jgi:hypothetical protein